MKKLLLFISVCMSAAFAMANDYYVTSGNLKYTILSEEEKLISIEGHVDGENAIGPVVFPQYVTHNSKTYKVVALGLGSFKYSPGLTGNLVFPEGITSIREFAFQESCGFTGSLIFPQSLKTLGSFAFSKCTGLSGSPQFLGELEVLESYTFSGCTGLNGTLNLPKGLTEIKLNAFYECAGFTGELKIPHTVKSIESGAFTKCKGFTSLFLSPECSFPTTAFQKCDNITTVYSPGVVPPVVKVIPGVEMVFDANKTTLYIPEGEEVLERYRNAPFWENFIHVKQMVFVGTDQPIYDKITLEATVVTSELLPMNCCEGNYAIISASGLLVKQGYYAGSSIDVSSLADGVYILRLNNGSLRFVKR